MRRDPLATLLRLRALEVAAAQRDLAQRAQGAQAADARLRHATATMAAELTGEGAGFADSLAAWLPQARTACESAAGEARLAEQAAEVARRRLAEARAAEGALEQLCAQRAWQLRAEAAQRLQASLDEAAQRRRG
jgi:flagellar biosynthesis chaperone FliJ